MGSIVPDGTRPWARFGLANGLPMVLDVAEPMRTSSEIITAYLTAAGWTGAELARRARLDQSAITRLIRGRKRDGETSFDVGELVALKIERATIAAYESGDTNAAPLRATDLRADTIARREAAKSKARAA